MVGWLDHLFSFSFTFSHVIYTKTPNTQAFALPVLSEEERRLRLLPKGRKRRLPAALTGALGGAFGKVGGWAWIYTYIL